MHRPALLPPAAWPRAAGGWRDDGQEETMVNRMIQIGAACLLAAALVASGSGCTNNEAKPLEQLSEQDASKKANDLFEKHMGKMGEGSKAKELKPAGAPGTGTPGGPPPG